MRHPDLRKKVPIVLIYFVKLKAILSLYSGMVRDNLIKTFLISFVEPVGYKSPVFSSDAESARFRKRSSNDLSVLCSAQGYPAPSFR